MARATRHRSVLKRLRELPASAAYLLGTRTRHGAFVMKIGIVSTGGIPTPPPGYGGIERAVHQWAEWLQAHGDEVTVFAKPGSKGGTYELVERDVTYPLPSECGQFDVLGVHESISLKGRIGWRLDVETVRRLVGFARRVPTVFSFHHGLPYWVRPLAMSGLWPRSLILTTPSVPQLEYARRHRIRDVVFAQYPVEEGTFRDSHEKNQNLCWVGAITRRKAPHHAIQIAKACGRDIVVAGPVQEDAYFEELVKPELAAYDRATFIGEVWGQAKDDLLSKSAALLMTTVGEEPFGIIVTEAIVRGTPCISTPCGAAERAIGSTRGGIVVRDGADWVQAVEQAVRMPHRDAMRDACIAQFGVDASAAAYREALRTAAARRR